MRPWNHITIRPSASSSATRRGEVRRPAAAAKPALRSAASNRRRVVVRSEIETIEIELDRLAALRRGDDGGAERKAAVAHVREHVDVLHLGQQADAPRRLDVRHHAAGQREPRSPVSRTASRASATHVCSTTRCARYANCSFGYRQWIRASAVRSAWPGRVGLDDAVTHANPATAAGCRRRQSARRNRPAPSPCPRLRARAC